MASNMAMAVHGCLTERPDEKLTAQQVAEQACSLDCI